MRFHQGKDQRQGENPDPRSLLLGDTVYLEDSLHEEKGIRLYGSPWQPEFCDWAFNVNRGADIKKKWDLVPECEILVTHGPAHGALGGHCANGFDAGCEELRKILEQKKPLVHVFGHIHESYGVYMHKGVICINASSVNLNYRATNPPIVFDIIRK